MWDWIYSAVELVAEYPTWALAIAFIAAIIEAVAVLGILIPGTPIVMAVAAAAAAAGQPMAPFLVLVVIGAIVGDFLSFWVGHRYRDTLRQVWPLSRRPDMMERADRFFERYGIYSIAFCRFLPVFRSTVPLVAGMAGMSRNRFVLANVCSALVWAPAHVYPAQMAGMTIDRLHDGDWQSACLLALGLVVLCLGAWWLHRRFAARVNRATA
ncbi:MAG: DedA family protein [Acetobacteraceae bacterium]